MSTAPETQRPRPSRLGETPVYDEVVAERGEPFETRPSRH